MSRRRPGATAAARPRPGTRAPGSGLSITGDRRTYSAGPESSNVLGPGTGDRAGLAHRDHIVHALLEIAAATVAHARSPCDRLSHPAQSTGADEIREMIGDLHVRLTGGRPRRAREGQNRVPGSRRRDNVGIAAAPHTGVPFKRGARVKPGGARDRDLRSLRRAEPGPPGNASSSVSLPWRSKRYPGHATPRRSPESPSEPLRCDRHGPVPSIGRADDENAVGTETVPIAELASTLGAEVSRSVDDDEVVAAAVHLREPHAAAATMSSSGSVDVGSNQRIAASRRNQVIWRRE